MSLITEVQELAVATTSLLTAVNDAKEQLDAGVNEATQARNEAVAAAGGIAAIGEDVAALVSLAPEIEASASQAAASAAVAQAARDAALVAGPKYTTEALGRAAVADGAVFMVQGSADVAAYEYRRVNAGSSTLIATYPSKAAVDALGIEAVTDEQEIAFGVVDQDGRRTWLETTKGGTPTARAAEKIGAALTPENTPAMLTLSDLDEGLNDLSISLVDEDGRRTWLEAGLDGKPTSRSAALILSRLESIGFSPIATTYKAGHQAAQMKIVSGPDIVCWGDSMTAGAGGAGTTYPNALQGFLTAVGYPGTVYNAGVGGETSVTITARSGANPFIVDVVGGVIPASGAVVVTFREINGQIVRPLLQGTGISSGLFAGSLHGVPGVITLVKPNGGSTWDPANYYQFTRDTPGAEVTANRPYPYYTNFSNSRRGDINLMWIGQNGPSNTRAIEDARAIVQHMTALDKRFLVISKPTSTDADDAAWFAEFGRRFVPIRKYLVEFGLSDAGIAATSQDTADMAAGIVPVSLRSDAIHWLGPAYSILANVVFKRFNELGWI
jgi:hypothetical protein